jgi:DNA-binding beta-propeller fold protein YncE
VHRILVQYRCVNCHNNDRAENGLNLSSWEAIKRGGSGGAVVFPGNAEWSPLLWHVNHFGTAEGYAAPSLMPYRSLGNNAYQTDSANLLSLADYQLLRSWIANGAPNCAGTPMWAERTTTGSGKFFFLNSGADLVGVMDAATNRVMTYFSVGQNPSAVESPHYVCHSPGGDYIYVTLIQGGTVEKYRADNYQFVARSPHLGAQVAHVEASQDGQWLMVTNWAGSDATGKIFVLNANTLQVVDSSAATIYNKMHGLALAPDFTTAYVTCNGGNYNLKISLNPTTGAITNIVPFSLDGNAPSGNATQAPYQCVLNPEGTRLFVTSQGENAVYMYDVSGSGAPQLLDVEQSDGSDCVEGVGRLPKLLVYHQGRLYVACWYQRCPSSDNRQRSGCVSVLNTQGNTLTWERNIYGLGQETRGLAVDPTRQRLYVCNSNQGTGGGDSPHHGVGGTGSLNWVDISNPLQPTVQWVVPVDAALFPTGATFVP